MLSDDPNVFKSLSGSIPTSSPLSPLHYVIALLSDDGGSPSIIRVKAFKSDVIMVLVVQYLLGSKVMGTSAVDLG